MTRDEVKHRRGGPGVAPPRCRGQLLTVRGRPTQLDDNGAFSGRIAPSEGQKRRRVTGRARGPRGRQASEGLTIMSVV